MKAVRSRVAGVASLLIAVAACSDPIDVTRAMPDAEAQLESSSFGATILECPSSSSNSVSRTIGPLGGELEVNGHRLVIPLKAVLVPTKLTLEVPASNYLEIDVRADGAEHYEFHEPVSMTISYERCTRSNIEGESLRAYYIDGVTKEILADLGGVDDKERRTVTFGTDHLSDYAVGAP